MIGSLAFHVPAYRPLAAVAAGPTWLDCRTNGFGNPTTPTAPSNGIAIAVGYNPASSTLPTLAGWGTPVLAEVHPGGNQAIAMYVTATPTAMVWTNAPAMRAAWSFENAALDTVNVSNGSGSTFAWEAQPTMTANSLVGVFVGVTGGQTDITVPLAAAIALGLTERVAKNSSSAGWVGDSGANKLSAFAPAGGTFDTNPTKSTALVFSIKAA